MNDENNFAERVKQKTLKEQKIQQYLLAQAVGISYRTAETLHEIKRIKLHRQELAVERRVAVAEFA